MPRLVFRLGDDDYAMPTSFRFSDHRLVEQTTQLRMHEWLERFQWSADEQREDPIVAMGMLAVAIAQHRPGWDNEHIVRFVQGLHVDDVNVVDLDKVAS